MSHWLSTLVHRWSRGFRRTSAGRDLVARQWVTVGVSGPAPLLEMYRDLLGQHGIPAVVTDVGVGPGALGGVPGFGSLRVHAADADRARELIHDEDRTADGGSDSERIVTRGE